MRYTPPNPHRPEKFKGVPLICSSCGRTVGSVTTSGVNLGVICDNPICRYQGPADLNAQRDAFVVAAALGGVAASRIATATNVSRQRVYQIVDAWKRGV